MTYQLVISALGEDQPGIVKSVSKYILDCGGNIVESHMSVLGGEFALMVLVSGETSALQAIESGLPEVAEAMNLTLICKHTTPQTEKAQGVPYGIEIIAMDHPGIVHVVTDYLAKQRINVEELSTDSYAAPHTGTPMFALNVEIAIPAATNISEFRKNFTNFCDDLNLDVNFEARK
ncbi:MAG: ACT domain-containing protein [Gammaproteobacteria bacterium]|nr:ACT domain-containing protein [Gammaproteobacteria bacterium]